MKHCKNPAAKAANPGSTMTVLALVVKQDGPGVRPRMLGVEVGGCQFVHRLAQDWTECLVVGVGTLFGDPEQDANTGAIGGAGAVLDRAVVQPFQILRQQRFQRP